METYVLFGRPRETGHFTGCLDKADGCVRFAHVEEEDSVVVRSRGEHVATCVKVHARHGAIVRLKGLLQCQLALALHTKLYITHSPVSYERKNITYEYTCCIFQF